MRTVHSTGSGWWDLYYVRIVGFGTGSPLIVTRRLTTASFQLDPALGFLGDYQHMTPAAGTPKPTVYTAYIRTAEASGSEPRQLNCYLHKITFTCLSDLNGSGAADPEDIDLFTAAFEGGAGFQDDASVADLNQDGAVDSTDSTLFWASYYGGG